MLALVLALSLHAAPAPSSTTGPAPARVPPDAAAAPAPNAAVAGTALGLVPPPIHLAPPLDPGPFGGAELLGAAGGVLAADLAIAGAAYATLLLFANDTFSPNAANFRRAAYVFAFAALVGPPLAATLFGNWASPGPRGRLLRAWIVGLAAQVAAVFAGIAAAPRYWVALPAQLVTVTVGTSLGLHWGGAGKRSGPRPEARADPPPAEPAPAPVAWAPAVCPAD